MAMVTEQFDRVAEAVLERTAELLAADVAVVDDRGVTLASTDPDLVGLRFDAVQPDPTGCLLRVPLRVDAHEGQVIVGAPVTGEAPSPRLVQALVELVVNQAAVLDQIPKRHELKDKFIHDLLRGQIGDEADVLREAQILGMDFTRPRAVILIDAAEFIRGASTPHLPETAEVQRRRRAQLVIASVVGFFDLPSDSICAYIGDGDIAVLKASSTQDLVAWTDEDSPDQPAASWANLSALKRAADALLARLRRDTGAHINVGIGRYHPGIRGLARSYQDARAALSLGRRFHGQNRVHCLDGLGMAGSGSARPRWPCARPSSAWPTSGRRSTWRDTCSARSTTLRSCWRRSMPSSRRTVPPPTPPRAWRSTATPSATDSTRLPC